MNIETFEILSLDSRTSACITVCPIENLEEIGQKITRGMADEWIHMAHLISAISCPVSAKFSMGHTVIHAAVLESEIRTSNFSIFHSSRAQILPGCQNLKCVILIF